MGWGGVAAGGAAYLFIRECELITCRRLSHLYRCGADLSRARQRASRSSDGRVEWVGIICSLRDVVYKYEGPLDVCIIRFVKRLIMGHSEVSLGVSFLKFVHLQCSAWDSDGLKV